MNIKLLDQNSNRVRLSAENIANYPDRQYTTKRIKKREKIISKYFLPWRFREVEERPCPRF